MRILGLTAAVAIAGLPACSSSGSTAGHPGSPTVPSVSALPGGRNTQLPKDFPIPTHGRLLSAKENPNGGVMLKYADVDKSTVDALLGAFAEQGWRRQTIQSDATGANYLLTREQAQTLIGWQASDRGLTMGYSSP